ncbi:MAG: hypothetical protein JKX91_06485 [Rhizobiaceae bacterium]|nr:hypothetical protein [Rhizobiaceae bacterium]
MPQGGGGADTDFIAETGLDADATTTTSSVIVGDNSLIAIFITANTGTHATHVVTLQISPDGSNWFDTSHTITGVGQLHNITCVAIEARAKVTTNEGATSTIDIDIITK